MFDKSFRKQSTSMKAAIIITIFLLAEILSGCASFSPTRPNKPYQGEYPLCFEFIRNENNLLAQEIGRLPEIQDGFQGDEEFALQILCDVYKEDTNLFNHVFKEIYDVGLPNVRKYCSPLQAIFWLAQEGDRKKISNILNNYSLYNLLYQAWQFGTPTLSDSEISEILKDMSDENLKEEYLNCREIKTCSNQKLQKYLLIDYRSNSAIFSKKAKDILESKKSNENPLWSDFDTVIERLNSPELVNYYERAQVRWVDWRTLPGRFSSPMYVFNYKEGDCTAIANFTALCLTRAGYKAYEIKVASRRPVDNYHSICVFFIDGIKYAMDNGVPMGNGIYLYNE